jgi:dsRNA-specific ribonuclease
LDESTDADALVEARNAAQARELVGDALLRFLMLHHIHTTYRFPRLAYEAIAALITSNNELNALAAQAGIAPFEWRTSHKALASALEEHVYALFLSDGLGAAREFFTGLVEQRYDLVAMAQSFEARRVPHRVLRVLRTVGTPDQGVEIPAQT